MRSFGDRQFMCPASWFAAGAFLLTACGGGNGTTAPSAPHAAASVSAKISLTLARASSSAKRPSFLDAATQSLVITLTQVGGAPLANPPGPTIANVGNGVAGCTASGASTICRIDVTAVLGADTFTIAAYDHPNGQGSALSVGAVDVAVSQDGPNTAAIALSGVAASSTLSVAPATLRGGIPATATLMLTAKDAAGNTIVGSAPYAAPIAVTSDDTSGSIVMSPSSFGTPGDKITVTYGGFAGTTSPTFSAGAGSTPVTLAIPPPHQSLYIVDDAGGVLIFAPGSNGNVAPIRTIAGANTGLSQPHGVALDAAGNIYVADYGNGSITEYAPDASGNATPLRTIIGANTTMSSPAQAPWGIAVDASGNIYVAIINGSTFVGGGMRAFGATANGNVAPIAALSGALTTQDDSNDVSIDASGNVHLANTNGTYPDALVTFVPLSTGNVPPIRSVSGAATGLSTLVLFQEAFDGAGDTYVAGIGGANTGVYAFGPGASGNVAPIVQLKGANTGLTNPRGVLFDAAGNLYVSNIGPGNPPVGSSINVFAPGSNGNVGPFRSITGSNTQLSIIRFMAMNP